jgi:predicted lipid carrier protein YhbT
MRTYEVTIIKHLQKDVDVEGFEKHIVEADGMSWDDDTLYFKRRIIQSETLDEVVVAVYPKGDVTVRVISEL